MPAIPDGRQIPYLILGEVKDVAGSTVAGVNTTVTNLTNPGNETVQSNAQGEYIINAANLSDWSDNDVLRVETDYYGYKQTYITTIIKANGSEIKDMDNTVTRIIKVM